MSTVNSTSSSSTNSSSSNSIYKTSSRITGMFSNLDTDSLVKSMTSVQQSRIDSVKKQQTKQGWVNDALASVKSDVSDFLNTYVSASGSSSMLKASTYETFQAVTSSTANAVSVTGSSSAEMGDLTIQVNTLAANSSTASSAKVSKNGTQISVNNTATLSSLSLGTSLQFGTDNNISFGINGKTFTFSKDTTLQSMINTVNSDTTANVTMKYSRLSDTFSVTADSGGADSSVTIANYKGNAFGTSGAFKINTGTFKNGTDSEAVINGSTVTHDSNNFTVDGITYDLKKVTKGTSEATVNYSLERDYSSTVSAVSKFVDAYNTLYSKLKSLDSEADNSADYPPLTDDQKSAMTSAQITAWETKAKSGLLRHNSDLESMMSGLRNAFYSSVGGTGKNATEIGISTAGYYESNAGQAVLNEDTLTSALQNDPDAVIKMLTGGNSTSESSAQGLIYKIKNSMTNYNTAITNSIKTGTTKISSYDTQISDLEDKMSSLADSYYAKFSKMETALSKLNSQSSMISQMFSSSSSSSSS